MDDVMALYKDPQSKPPQPEHTYLVALRRGTGRTLLLVHSITGHVIKYSGLARRVHPSFNVRGLHAVPLFTSDVAFPSISQLAARYVDEICRHQLMRDCVVMGYCAGGLIALELAGQLAARGHPPRLLGLVDTYHPMLPLVDADGELTRDSWAAFVEAFLSRDRALQLYADKAYWPLPRSVRLERVLELARTAPNLLLPRSASLQDLEVALARYSSFMRILQQHVPSAYGGDTVCVGSKGSCAVMKHTMVGKYLTGKVAVSLAPGSHASFLEGIAADVVVEAVHASLGLG